MSPEYVPHDYWEDLLASDYSSAGVAHPGLSVSLNDAFYRAQERAVDAAVRKHRVVLAGASVLDIGSGTGIWLDHWRRAGAARIAGVDLTDSAVQHLQARFPALQIHRGDVSASEFPVDGEFDVISVMSVLLHITDLTRVEAALSRISGLLKPGGTLILIEPVVVHRWWGPSGPELNSVARPLAQWESLLARQGLEIEDLQPVTVLFNNVADTRTHAGWLALSAYWYALGMGVGPRERLGAVAAAVLTPLDRALVRFARTGSSTKCVVIRRTRSAA